MMASSLVALREMGMVAMFTMAFTLASDVVLAPALYLLLRPRRVAAPVPVPAADAGAAVAPVLA